MRKTLRMAGLALLFITTITSQAQINLNWATSFIPLWLNGNTSGTALAIGGTSINCSVSATITGGGSFQQALGSSGAQTPTVSGATFTVPGTTSRLQVTPNFSNNTGYCNIVLTFSALSTNVSFKIVDIDKSDATSTTYFDRVTVTGSDGVNTYNATITKYDAVTDPNFLIISGNSARVNTTSGQGGNTASDASDQRGTVVVSFGATALHTVTIHYDEAPGADVNPASQAIAIGAVSFVATTLPVTLTSFEGYRQSQHVILNWTSEQELSLASYIIERNDGNGNWNAIGNVNARGSLSTSSSYTYTDMNAMGAVLLYRLKMVDVDGHYKYSNIIRITGTNNTPGISSYPNPFTNSMNVSINSATDQAVTTILTDVIGKTIRSEIKNLYSGNNNFTIGELDKLKPGIYFIRVIDANGQVTGQSKLMKE